MLLIHAFIVLCHAVQVHCGKSASTKQHLSSLQSPPAVAQAVGAVLRRALQQQQPQMQQHRPYSRSRGQRLQPQHPLATNPKSCSY
jgi:hypothetical protein